MMPLLWLATTSYINEDGCIVEIVAAVEAIRYVRVDTNNGMVLQSSYQIRNHFDLRDSNGINVGLWLVYSYRLGRQSEEEEKN